jgi:hypothetical protein
MTPNDMRVLTVALPVVLAVFAFGLRGLRLVQSTTVRVLVALLILPPVATAAAGLAWEGLREMGVVENRMGIYGGDSLALLVDAGVVAVGAGLISALFIAARRVWSGSAQVLNKR